MYAGERLQKIIKKNKKITEFDLFLLKLECLLEWIDLEKKRFKNNLNSFRMILEKVKKKKNISLLYMSKVITGFKFSLNYTKITNSKQSKKIYKNLLKFKCLLFGIQCQKALILSVKLFKKYCKCNKISDIFPKFLKIFIKKNNLKILRVINLLHNVYIPLFKILQLNEDERNLSKFLLFYKIDKLLKS